jgi:uncharacterized protein (TIGR03435 family)
MCSIKPPRTERLIWAPVVFSGLLLAAVAIGQQFEVASIKPSTIGFPGGQIRWNAGSLRVTNMTLKELIQHAWDVQDFQVTGAADWMDSIRFNISAKPESATKNWKENAPLLQSLLADRFHLVIRHETKELPVYALVWRERMESWGRR